jgi:hypothetical protein
MDELKKNPLPQHKKPAYPNYHPGGDKAAQKMKKADVPPGREGSGKEINPTKELQR